MNTKYTTWTEVIEREIIPALGQYVDDFDVDAIAEAVIECHSGHRAEDNYFCMGVDEDEFWKIVEAAAL